MKKKQGLLTMTNKEVELLLNNDKEWRKWSITEIREIRKAQSSQGVKVAVLETRIKYFVCITAISLGYLYKDVPIISGIVKRVFGI